MKIATHGLVAGYAGQPKPALDDVSMTAEDGSLYAVLGPNGSGKSTLMRTIMGVLPIRSGRATLDGVATGDWDRKELARAVGAVAQSETISFPLTVRELVGMGRYPHLGPLAAESESDREAVMAALEECDAVHLTQRDVGTLSGGELQRVRIARALAQRPRALLLDEPTSSLDIRHEMAILELLRRSADGGLTVIWVTHGLDLAARFSDRMLLLSEGRVAAEGAPDDVLREDVLREVYRWPVSVTADSASGALRVTPARAPTESS